MSIYTDIDMWKIHGITYDLTNYIDKHPGGKDILEKTKNMKDCSALFESYHAFSDMESIKLIMKKYEVVDKPHDECIQDFSTYQEIVKRVKPIIQNKESTKASISWYLWVYILIITGIPSFYYMSFSKLLLIRYFFSILSACVDISLLYNVMHDSSHYAISNTPYINNYISKFSQSWLLWNHDIWTNHHIILHHSFTGNDNDPDNYLYNHGSYIYTQILPIIENTKIIEYIINFLYVIFPGQYVSQTIWFCVTILNNYIKNIHKNCDSIDISIMIFKCIILYNSGFLPTIQYFLIMNMFYYINVFADHDLYESKIENHYDGPDWAIRQICNSGNFMNQNMWWTTIFSGINYQIEHHLFPNICGHKYPLISPIIVDFCKEKNIPHAHHNTFSETYNSFMKRIRIMYSNKKPKNE